MRRVYSWLPVLALAAVWTQSASAHFLWLLTTPAGGPNKVQLYFSEAAEPDDPDLLDRVLKAEVWSVGGFRGEPKLLSLSKGEDALEADLPANSSAIVLRHTYGVMERGGTSMLLNYYGKTYPSPLPGTWREIKDIARLPLEVTPKPDGTATNLRVIWRGEPLEGATVTVTGPGIDDKLEGTTDASGNYRCELPQAGVYSIRAKHVEATPGKHEDKEYKEARHYSTLSLRHVPASLSPVASNFPALPQGTTSFGGAVIDDTLFAYGGNYGNAHEFSNEEQSGDLWTLNLKSPTEWKKVSGGTKLQGLAMVAHHNWLYRVGGFTAINKDGEEQNLQSQDDFARMRADSPTWEALPQLPEPRSSHDAAIVGDTLYVVGGWNMQGGGRDAHWLETALSLDLTAEKPEWKTIAAPPFQRRALALAAWNGKLYCIGGMQEDGGPTTAVAIYDPAKDAWSEGPSLLGGNMDGFGSSAFACQGALYITTQSGSIQRLSADGASWEYLGQLDHPRFFHRLLPWSDANLIIVGGSSMASGKTEELELLKIGDSAAAAR
ncbi:MAG: hypothetical protein AB7O62_07330 [Pirellulales bacterium]